MTQAKMLGARQKKAKKVGRKTAKFKADTIPDYFIHFEKDRSELAKFFGPKPISMQDLQTKLWKHLSKNQLIVSEQPSATATSSRKRESGNS